MKTAIGAPGSFTDIAFDSGAIWERTQILEIVQGYLPRYCQQISHQLCPSCEQTQAIIKHIELRGNK